MVSDEFPLDIGYPLDIWKRGFPKYIAQIYKLWIGRGNFDDDILINLS